MFKFLFLAFAVWLLVRILKGYQKSMSQKESAANKPNPSAQQNENMVQCAHCGVHLPQNESYLSKQLYYCSQAHMDLHASQKTD